MEIPLKDLAGHPVWYGELLALCCVLVPAGAFVMIRFADRAGFPWGYTDRKAVRQWMAIFGLIIVPSIMAFGGGLAGGWATWSRLIAVRPPAVTARQQHGTVMSMT